VITRSVHVMYYVSDMKRSQAFYRDVLGLKPKHEHAEWTEYELAGGPSLALHPGLKARPQGGAVLGVEVEDIKEARKKLEAAGVKVPHDFHGIPGGVILDILDPDGYTIELVQYTKKQGTW